MFLSQTDPVLICLMILDLLSTWNSLLQINRCDLTKCGLMMIYADAFCKNRHCMFQTLVRFWSKSENLTGKSDSDPNLQPFRNSRLCLNLISKEFLASKDSYKIVPEIFNMPDEKGCEDKGSPLISDNILEKFCEKRKRANFKFSWNIQQAKNISLFPLSSNCFFQFELQRRGLQCDEICRHGIRHQPSPHCVASQSTILLLELDHLFVLQSPTSFLP